MDRPGRSDADLDRRALTASAIALILELPCVGPALWRRSGAPQLRGS